MCGPDTPETVTIGYKDLINRPTDPELDGPPKPGRIYFTGKIFTNLTLGQKIRTGSNNPDSRRKNQKSRPWLVLYVRGDGNISVISLTTRNNKLWEGLSEDDVNSFLPLGTTPTIPGRGEVKLLSNICGIFRGTSLIFLEVERVVPASSLGHPVGEITPEGLALVRSEREICAEYWRQQKGRQVYAGGWKQSYALRPPNSTGNGRPRAISFTNDQFSRDRLQRGQTERYQLDESNIERERIERGQIKRYQIEGGQFERGQIKGQAGLVRKDKRRWSIQ